MALNTRRESRRDIRRYSRRQCMDKRRRHCRDSEREGRLCRFRRVALGCRHMRAKAIFDPEDEADCAADEDEDEYSDADILLFFLGMPFLALNFISWIVLTRWVRVWERC